MRRALASPPVAAVRSTVRSTAVPVALSLALLALLAAPVLAQNEALVGSFRPYRHVLLAFGAAWVVIGAWVFRIGRKLDRVVRLAEERSSDPDR